MKCHLKNDFNIFNINLEFQRVLKCFEPPVQGRIEGSWRPGKNQKSSPFLELADFFFDFREKI